MKLDDTILNGTHGYTEEKDYVQPEQQIQKRLEWFQDQKFALMVTFGLYNQLGIRASWGLSDHDAHWSRKGDAEWAADGRKFREVYFNLNKSFNPVRLQAEEWAKFAKKSGFKYLIFITKHHDGFCLWDTKETEYKSTAKDCPYHSNKNADIVKVIFDAFRKEGIGIGAYFSKPDWYSPYFWAPGMEHSEPTWRLPSYDPEEYPELWEKFVQYTHNQMLELVRDYGKIDILWLDGGQVNPRIGLDIRLGEVVKKAREINPELIVVDRTIGGEYENYITPEQTIPEEPILVPWESCLTLGKDFSYDYDDKYKSAKEVLTLLIDIVCKGGNLALNISPQPDGRMPGPTIEVMREVGEWLKKYGEAIYGTRPCAPYKKDGIAFTQKEENVYAILLEEQSKPLRIPYTDGKIEKIECMNSGEEISFRQDENGITFEQEIAKIFTVFKLCRPVK